MRCMQKRPCDPECWNGAGRARALTIVLAALSMQAASAGPTDTDPYGVEPYRSCGDRLVTGLSEAVDSLNALDARMPAVPPGKEAFFGHEDPHIFEAHDPKRAAELFGDPYYPLWTLHRRIRALASDVRQFGKDQQRPLPAARELWLTGRLMQGFVGAMGALVIAATSHAREGGPDSPLLLTDEQVVTYQQNLEGIAMYVTEYGRCRATTLETRGMPGADSGVSGHGTGGSR